MKRLPSSVSWDKTHAKCSIIGEVVHKVDAVLAIIEKVDIWNSSWGPGSGGKEVNGERT